MNSMPALVISPRDNVATALQPLEAGQVLVLGGESITIAGPTPKGHIQPGVHVHTHNVASGRGRGDLSRGTTEPQPSAEADGSAPDQPRIAEPPDLSPITGKAVQ